MSANCQGCGVVIDPCITSNNDEFAYNLTGQNNLGFVINCPPGAGGCLASRTIFFSCCSHLLSAQVPANADGPTVIGVFLGLLSQCSAFAAECGLVLPPFTFTAPGSGTGPVPPALVPTRSPITSRSIFFSNPVSCNLDCIGGGSFTWSEPAGKCVGLSQAAADATALALCKSEGAVHQICLSGISEIICFGAAQNISILATGGFASKPAVNNVWTISGTLPTGLTFNGGTLATGVAATITGTTSTAGSFTFTITVVVSNGDTTSQTYTVCVAQITGNPAGSDAVTLPAFTIGSLYTEALQVPGCAGDAVFALVSGILPDGLSMDAEGNITGTPSMDAATEGFTVSATMDAGQGVLVTCDQAFTLPIISGINFNLTVWDPPSNSSFGDGTVFGSAGANNGITASFAGTSPTGGNASSILNGNLPWTGASDQLCNCQINFSAYSGSQSGLIFVNSSINGTLLNQPVNTIALSLGTTNIPFTVPAAIGDTITITLRSGANSGGSNPQGQGFAAFFTPAH